MSHVSAFLIFICVLDLLFFLDLLSGITGGFSSPQYQFAPLNFSGPQGERRAARVLREEVDAISYNLPEGRTL